MCSPFASELSEQFCEVLVEIFLLPVQWATMAQSWAFLCWLHVRITWRFWFNYSWGGA